MVGQRYLRKFKNKEVREFWVIIIFLDSKKKSKKNSIDNSEKKEIIQNDEVGEVRE
jgi:hypothetical protein